MNPFTLLTTLFTQVLLFFAHLFGGNLGLAIIAITALIKIALLPLVIPTIKSTKKMQDLKPHLDNLKAKFKDDKTKLQQAQLDLYKEHGINPAAGCLPQLVQIFILIALYNVFNQVLHQTSPLNLGLDSNFLYLNLTKPDPFYILPVLAGVTQLVFSFMMQSGLESHLNNPKKKDEKKKEEDSMEMAQTMQQQMLYTMPLMTVVISLNFQSGLILYWVVSTIFSIVQQYYFSGLGGLRPILVKFKLIKVNNKNG